MLRRFSRRVSLRWQAFDRRVRASAVRLRHTVPESNGGFTLLEVLVALAILSIAMVALYGVMGDAAYRLAQAQLESVAVALARSKLEEVGATIAPVVGDTSGASAGGYEWQVSIALHGTPEDRVAWPAALIDVSVMVAWQEAGRRKSIKVHTLKVLPRG